jgi:hypothetical protein
MSHRVPTTASTAWSSSSYRCSSRSRWDPSGADPSHEHIRSWVQDVPGPVVVIYEAGPTGFGLYRALSAAGIRSADLACDPAGLRL